MSADPRVSTEAAVARLSAQMEGIGREIGQMRREIADKLGDLAMDVADTKAQAKITNGRVTAHDREIDRIQTREQVRTEILADQQDKQEKRITAERDRQDRRMRLMQWVIGVALAILIPAVGWLITIVG